MFGISSVIFNDSHEEAPSRQVGKLRQQQSEKISVQKIVEKLPPAVGKWANLTKLEVITQIIRRSMFNQRLKRQGCRSEQPGQGGN